VGFTDMTRCYLDDNSPECCIILPIVLECPLTLKGGIMKGGKVPGERGKHGWYSSLAVGGVLENRKPAPWLYPVFAQGARGKTETGAMPREMPERREGGKREIKIIFH